MTGGGIMRKSSLSPWLVLCASAACALLVACASGGSGAKPVYERSLAIDPSTQLVMQIFLVDDDLEPADGMSVLDVRNNLDRNLQLDMDGPSHNQVSVGNQNDYRTKVAPGSYRIRASAPAIAHVPGDFSYAFEANALYRIDVSMRHDTKHYRE
jgi:hypothetical protein